MIYSANGFLAQPEDTDRSGGSRTADVVRDVCTAAGLGTLVASITLESWHFGGLAYSGWAGPSMSGNYLSRHGYLGFGLTIAVLLMHMLLYYSLLLMVSPHLSLRGPAAVVLAGDVHSTALSSHLPPRFYHATLLMIFLGRSPGRALS